MSSEIELLSPAKDAETAIAAILAGADAVYMGAPKFGARMNAGNSIEDIAELADFAHKFGAKVYIALNTVLNESQIREASELTWALHDAKVDALIIQDLGLLVSDIAPIPLHASTQCHITSLEKAKFLEDTGKFETMVLARELSLREIEKIAKGVSCNIECFVHGALCVGFSGQCFLSSAIGGRSGNRGNCAQPCREFYSLENAEGRKLAEGYLLSLKDMNRSAHVGDMIDAGVSSFKIEGRLKNASYVKNITLHYRNVLDFAIAERGLQKSSFGKSFTNFEPAPEKTFGRDFCDCRLNDFTLPRAPGLASFGTPKSKGEFLGKIKKLSEDSFCICENPIEKEIEKISNSDGLFFESETSPEKNFGAQVRKVDGEKIFIETRILREGNFEKIKNPKTLPETGMKVWRNKNSEFEKSLNLPQKRLINARLGIEKFSGGKISFFAEAFDDCENKLASVVQNLDVSNLPEAKNPEEGRKNIEQRLRKLGGTIFEAQSVSVPEMESSLPFIPAAQINETRRKLVEKLEAALLLLFDKKREHLRLKREEKNSEIRKHVKNAKKENLNNAPRGVECDMFANINNAFAMEVYEAMGLRAEYSPEIFSHPDFRNKKLMISRHCILRELGKCKKKNLEKTSELSGALFLKSKTAKLRLEFDCKNCGMNLWLGL